MTAGIVPLKPSRGIAGGGGGGGGGSKLYFLRNRQGRRIAGTFSTINKLLCFSHIGKTRSK